MAWAQALLLNFLCAEVCVFFPTQNPVDFLATGLAATASLLPGEHDTNAFKGHAERF